jgi:hypothetical protein
MAGLVETGGGRSEVGRSRRKGTGQPVMRQPGAEARSCARTAEAPASRVLARSRTSLAEPVSRCRALIPTGVRPRDRRWSAPGVQARLLRLKPPRQRPDHLGMLIPRRTERTDGSARTGSRLASTCSRTCLSCTTGRFPPAIPRPGTCACTAPRARSVSAGGPGTASVRCLVPRSSPTSIA